MIKRALPAVAILLSVCLPLVVQAKGDEVITEDQLEISGAPDVGTALELYRPDLFKSVDSTLLIHGLPALTLLDGRRFPISTELGRMGMTPFDLFPLAFLNSVSVEKVSPSPMVGTDYPGGVVDLRLNRTYVGGEIGVFYGKSGGRYGREDFETYMIGGVGNDKVHFTAGASYGESSGKIPRYSR